MEESKYLSVNNYGNVSVVENEKYEWGVIDHNGIVDSIGINVPPVSETNVPPSAERNVPLVSD